ncbi:MAG: amidase, partial [Vicinamibacteria bacterium]
MADGVDRRTFLGSGLAVGIAGAIGSAPLAAARAGKQPSLFTPPDFDLEEATIADLQGRMESGEHTARSLTEAYQTRLEALDRDGPPLRAVLEPNPDA